MMQEALDLFYYIAEKTFNFYFNEAYIFNGVSLGMLSVVGIIFMILFTYLLAVPKIHVPDHRPITTRTMVNTVYKDENTRITESTSYRRR